MGLEEKQQERALDEVTYRVVPLPFGKGRSALVRLVKVIGPILSGLSSGATREAQLAGLFHALPEALSDDDLQYFAKTFGDASWFQNPEGKWVPLVVENQEGHFALEYLRFMRWLIFCIEVNFKSFFTGVMGQSGAGAQLLTILPSSSP